MVTQSSNGRPVRLPGAQKTPDELWNILHGSTGNAVEDPYNYFGGTYINDVLGKQTPEYFDEQVANNANGSGGAQRTALRRRVLGPGRTTAWSPEPEVVKDAAYYEKLAADRLGTSDWGGLRSRAEESVAQADARVRAMYRTLRAEQEKQQAETEASRSAAGQSIEASADQAAADIASAYAAAQNQQADLAARLGVEAAFPGATTMGEGSARNQAAAELAGQSAANANTADTQSQLEYQRGQQDVLGLEGASTTAGFQNDLLNRLAQLDFQASQEARNLPGEQLALAQQLRGWDQSFEPASLSFAEQLQLQQLSADNSLSLAKRKDEMFRFFADKKGMDDAAAAQAVNDYFAGTTQ